MTFILSPESLCLGQLVNKQHLWCSPTGARVSVSADAQLPFVNFFSLRAKKPFPQEAALRYCESHRDTNSSDLGEGHN